MTWIIGDKQITLGSSWWQRFKHNIKMMFSSSYAVEFKTEMKPKIKLIYAAVFPEHNKTNLSDGIKGNIDEKKIVNGVEQEKNLKKGQKIGQKKEVADRSAQEVKQEKKVEDNLNKEQKIEQKQEVANKPAQEQVGQINQQINAFAETLFLSEQDLSVINGKLADGEGKLTYLKKELTGAKGEIKKLREVIELYKQGKDITTEQLIAVGISKETSPKTLKSAIKDKQNNLRKSREQLTEQIAGIEFSNQSLEETKLLISKKIEDTKSQLNKLDASKQEAVVT